MRVRYSRRALSQVASVYEYLEGPIDRPPMGVRASIRSMVGRLSRMPKLGNVTDEGGVHVIVEPEYGYCVFYKIDRQQVFVLRILHGRQR